MQTNSTSEHTSSPPPGVIPGLTRVTVAPAPSPQRRNVFARLLRAVRGDKYMVDAYPAGEER
jgi:hypothetical protein